MDMYNLITISYIEILSQFCPNYHFNGTFKATPIAEQLNNLLMGRQNLFVDIFV
jgi:hypothetical protein